MSRAYAVTWQVEKKNLPVPVLAIIVNTVALLAYLIPRLYHSGSRNVITHDFFQLSSIFRNVVDDMAQPRAGSDRFRDSAEISLMQSYALGIQSDENGRPVISPVRGVNMIYLTPHLILYPRGMRKACLDSRRTDIKFASDMIKTRL
jgi:hypothetical protein